MFRKYNLFHDSLNVKCFSGNALCKCLIISVRICVFIYVNDTTVCYCSGGACIALKIIKNIGHYRDAAMSEVAVLEQINSLDCDRR